MNFKYRLAVALCLMLSWAVGVEASQLVRVTPEKPQWGQTLHMVYDPAAPEARLSVRDAVRVQVTITLENGVSRKADYPMLLRDGRFELDLPVQSSMAYLELYFTSVINWDPGWDARATSAVMVYRPDGRPARGANAQMGRLLSAGPDGFLDAFASEIEFYPDNFAAYANKWQVAGAHAPATLEKLVKIDMVAVGKRAAKDDPGWAYASSYGYLLLGDEPKARAVLERLLTAHPTHRFTELALSKYEYVSLAKRITGEGPERIAALKRELIKQYPTSQIARSAAQVLSWSPPPMAVNLMESICLPWIEEEPAHPQPYISLAASYAMHGVNLERAASLIEQGTNLLLQGGLRVQGGDVSGKISVSLVLPFALSVSAEIALKSGNLARGLGAIHAARALNQRTQSDYDDLEGRIWLAGGHLERAEKSFLKAYQGDFSTALASLRDIYTRRHGSSEGFEAHLAKLEGAAKETELALAPQFSATALDGSELNLQALRGKVVILNFWFINCAPCKAEMPELNRLVSRYAGREDVVFIGFAIDPPEALERFLRDTRFDYQIVPESSAVAADYGVLGFPTHVLIDRNGQIAATFGGPKHLDDLKPQIDRLLKSKTASIR